MFCYNISFFFKYIFCYYCFFRSGMWFLVWVLPIDSFVFVPYHFRNCSAYTLSILISFGYQFLDLVLTCFDYCLLRVRNLIQKRHHYDHQKVQYSCNEIAIKLSNYSYATTTHSSLNKFYQKTSVNCKIRWYSYAVWQYLKYKIIAWITKIWKYNFYFFLLSCAILLNLVNVIIYIFYY